MNNIFNVLKQAQDLKSKVSEFKNKLESAKFDAKDSTGQVEVQVTGKGVLLDINISSEFSEDSVSLKEKIKEAYSNAKILADEFSSSEIKKITGDIPLPFDLKSFL